MTRKTAYLLLAVATAGILLMTACGTSRKQSKADSPRPAETMPGEQRTAEGEFGALARSYGAWTDVSMPVKLQISQPKRISLSATAKMIRGKALSISVRVFGFEVGSLYADNDSVIVVAKVNDMYCSEALGAITDTYGLTLADIQSALLGQVFTPGSGVLASDDFKRYAVELGESTLSLTPKKLPKGLAWTFAAALGEGAPSLRSLTVNAGAREPIVFAYGTSETSAAGEVAPWVNVGAKAGKHTVDATLSWDLGRAKWDTGLTINKPRIPSGSRRIPASKIMEILKK